MENFLRRSLRSPPLKVSLTLILMHASYEKTYLSVSSYAKLFCNVWMLGAEVKAFTLCMLSVVDNIAEA